jgi:hypothetical protein
VQKRLIVLVLCAVLVSAVTVTSTVSARQVHSNTVKQSNDLSTAIAAAIASILDAVAKPMLKFVPGLGQSDVPDTMLALLNALRAL